MSHSPRIPIITRGSARLPLDTARIRNLHGRMLPKTSSRIARRFCVHLEHTFNNTGVGFAHLTCIQCAIVPPKTMRYTRRRLNARWGQMGTRANFLRVRGQPRFSWRCYCRAIAAAQRMQRAIYTPETQGLHSLHKLCMNCQLRGRVVERRVGSGRMLQVRKMMLDTVVLIYVALILISRST